MKESQDEPEKETRSGDRDDSDQASGQKGRLHDQ
jgi:hypothetical protein